MSILIENLLDTSPYHVAFFYCSRSIDSGGSQLIENDRIRATFQCILRQLAIAENGRTMSATISDLYERRRQSSRKKFRPSIKDLADVLVEIIDNSPGTVLLIDALDEFEFYRELLGFLCAISERTQNLKLCFSARPHIYVSQSFEKVIDIEISDHTDQDISGYLTNELSINHRQKTRKVPNQKQASELYKLLSGQATGM